jgi:hypothetical protein
LTTLWGTRAKSWYAHGASTASVGARVASVLQMTSLNTADFDFVLRYLWANQDKHTFKAIWAPNVAFGPGESCAGLWTLCRYTLGSTQLAKEQMVDWKDGLLGLTYNEYKTLPGFTLPPAVEAPLDLVDAQTTIFFQVSYAHTLGTIPRRANDLRHTWHVLLAALARLRVHLGHPHILPLPPTSRPR